MVYGDYGTGKTTLLGTAEDVASMNDILFIDVESGDLTLENRPDLNVIQTNSFKTVSRIFEFLTLHCRARDAGDTEKLKELEMRVMPDADPDAPPKRFMTVCIDSLSELYKYLMYDLLGVKIGERRLDQQMTKAQWDDWSQAAEMMRLLIRSFRDLPMNVLIAASQTIVEDEQRRQTKRPNFPGKLSGEVQGYLDIVGYLVSVPGEEGKRIRRLYIAPGKTFQAKNRLAGAIGAEYIEDPTMDKIMNLTLTATRTPDTTPVES